MFNAKSCLFSLEGSSLGGLNSQHKLLAAVYHHNGQKALGQWGSIKIHLLSRMCFTSCVDTNDLLAISRKGLQLPLPLHQSDVTLHASDEQTHISQHSLWNNQRPSEICKRMTFFKTWRQSDSVSISPCASLLHPALSVQSSLLFQTEGSHFQLNYHGHMATGSRAEPICRHTLNPWWTLHCSQNFKQSYVALHFRSIALGTLKHFVSGWRGLCHGENQFKQL